MIILIALLTTVPNAPPPAKIESRARARASVTILRGHAISARTWDPATQQAQREIIKKEVDGRHVRLRLTEFE